VLPFRAGGDASSVEKRTDKSTEKMWKIHSSWLLQE